MIKLNTPIQLTSIPFEVAQRGLDAFSMPNGVCYPIREFPVIQREYPNSVFSITQRQNGRFFIERHDHANGGGAFFPLSLIGFYKFVCPYCSSSEVRNAPDWMAKSQDPCDKNNTAILSEKQCHTCGKSFWV
jgi:hypothetical protein